MKDPTTHPAITLPRTIQARAAAKINLCLKIVGKRNDGYHLLESCLVPISIFDHLTIRLTPSSYVQVRISCSDPELANDRNLALKAARLILHRLGQALDVEIALEKHIPIGAGLGGGSSDAATVLLAVHAALGSPVPLADLTSFASELGADVPFFVNGKPAWVGGIGEEIHTCNPGPVGPLVVAFPGKGLRTAEVYEAYDRSLTKSRPESTIRPLTRGHVPLGELLVNDLESVAIQILPELQTLKQRLRELGAIHTLMTGSGSAVFGVWEDSKGASNAAQQMNDEGFWARTAQVLESTPRPK